MSGADHAGAPQTEKPSSRSTRVPLKNPPSPSVPVRRNVSDSYWRKFGRFPKIIVNCQFSIVNYQLSIGFVQQQFERAVGAGIVAQLGKGKLYLLDTGECVLHKVGHHPVDQALARLADTAA